MSEIIKINNGILFAEISTKGAELMSLKANGREYIWEGDPKVWGSRTPMCFPICGGVKDDSYILDGKTYHLPKHGFGKTSEFEVESLKEDKAVFLLKANEETKKMYPYDFELRVTFELIDNSLKETYDIKNLNDGIMYTSIGGHEGYACPEGIEEYSLVFDKEERLTTNPLHGNLLDNEPIVLGENVKEFPLKYDYFVIDALTFLNLKSRSVTLKKNDDSKRIRVDFEGFDYMFVWTMKDVHGKYICVEPWTGVPDFEGTSYEISEKKGMDIIEKGKTLTKVHTITIEK